MYLYNSSSRKVSTGPNQRGKSYIGDGTRRLDHLGYECSSNLADLADYSGERNQRTNEH